jgi:hypothetical protein
MSINTHTNTNKVVGINVLTTVQPTPTATGNTTNVNSTFKDANGDTWLVDANGDAIITGNSTSTLKLPTNEEFTPTTGQTAFTLAHTPNGDTLAFRNGILLPFSSYSVNGKNVTYNPSNNGGVTLLNTDRIQFHYSH